MDDDFSSCLESFGSSSDDVSKSLVGILFKSNSLAHNWDLNDLLGPAPIGSNNHNTINNSNNSNLIISNSNGNSNHNSDKLNNSRGFHGNPSPFSSEGSLHGTLADNNINKSSNVQLGPFNIGSSSSSSLLSRKGMAESKFNCDGLWNTNDLLSPLSDSSYGSLLSTSTSLSKGLEPCTNNITSKATSASTASCFDNIPSSNHPNLQPQQQQHHPIQRNTADLASSMNQLNLKNNGGSSEKSSYLFPPMVKGNGNCLFDIEPGMSLCHSNAVNVTSRRGTLSSHYTSSSSSSSIFDSPRIQEDEFESQIAKIANEIHSTIQLHMSGLQVRREQLLQQLENVKKIYLQLFKQQSSPSSPSTGSSCSSGSHVIEVNGFGGGNSNGNGGYNNGHRRIGFNQGRGGYESNTEIIGGGGGSHSLPLPTVTFTKPDSAILKAVSSLGFLTTPAFAPFCSATGDGLEVAVPGLNNNFTIVTRNCFNEELLIGRENIFVKIMPTYSSSSSSTTQNSSSSSSPSSSSSSSPLICASIYGGGSNGGGGGSNGGGSGNHNSHGTNKKDLLGLDVGSNLHSNLGSQSSSLNIPYTLLDHNNGKYTVTYLVPQSRILPTELSITILVNCIPLNDSPFHVPVQLEQRSRWRLGLTFGSEGNAIGQLCRPWGVAIVRMPPFMLTPQYMALNSGGGNNGNGGNGGCGENSNNSFNSSSSSTNANISSNTNHSCSSSTNHFNVTSTGNNTCSSTLTGNNNQVTATSCSSFTASTTGMSVGNGVSGGLSNPHYQSHQPQTQQKQANLQQHYGCDKIPQASSSSSGHQYFSSSNSTSSSHLDPPLQQSYQSTTQQHQLSATNSSSGQSTTGNSYTSLFSSDNSNGITIGSGSRPVIGLPTAGYSPNITNSITGIESSSCASSFSSSTGPSPNNSNINININRNGFNKSTTLNKINNNNKHYLIAVADRSNNRIQLLHFDAGTMSIKVLQVFGSGPGTRAGLFDRPAGITINTNLNHIIVADKDNHRIQVFDLSGRYQFKFGEKGNRAGQFCYPWDVDSCSHTHQLLVSDTRNRRVQLFTPYGQYITHFSHPLDSPRGVSFLGDNRIVVSDFNKHRLLIFDKSPSKEDASKVIGFGEGTGWGEFLRPQGISILGNSIFCADSRNNRICIYNLFTQSYEYLGQDLNCDRPSGLHVIDNILVIVDFGNNRLQICQR